MQRNQNQPLSVPLVYSSQLMKPSLYFFEIFHFFQTLEMLILCPERTIVLRGSSINMLSANANLLSLNIFAE